MHAYAYVKHCYKKIEGRLLKMYILVVVGHSFLLFLENPVAASVQEKLVYSKHVHMALEWLYYTIILLTLGDKNQEFKVTKKSSDEHCD